MVRETSIHVPSRVQAMQAGAGGRMYTSSESVVMWDEAAVQPLAEVCAVHRDIVYAIAHVPLGPAAAAPAIAVADRGSAGAGDGGNDGDCSGGGPGRVPATHSTWTTGLDSLVCVWQLR